MRSSAFFAAALAFVAATVAEAQVQDCTPPPIKDRVDFSLPCFKHPPAMGAEAKVYFSSNSSVLGDAARATLDRQAAALRKEPALKVGLFGHSDANEGEGIALSRAEAVRVYLISQGVSPTQLIAASRGSQTIVALKPSEEAFAAMRFVSTEPQ